MVTRSNSVVFSNISATTSAFQLKGGNYGVTVMATWGGGSVALQRLAADGSTYIPVTTAWTANAFQSINLPSGTYQLAVATATAVYIELAEIQEFL